MNTRTIRTAIPALMLGAALALPMAAQAANPCNPCDMKPHANPCNPCAMKTPTNPCDMKMHNPCDMKPHGKHGKAMEKKSGGMNPCSMRKANPCSMSHSGGKQWGTPGNTPIRAHAFDNFGQAVALGKKLWSDERLGTSGVSCLSCHGDYQLLHFERNQNFPHFVKMVGDVVTLDQMINYCMLNPMKGKAFDKNSKELTAMAAYYRAYRMQYLREHRK